MLASEELTRAGGWFGAHGELIVALGALLAGLALAAWGWGQSRKAGAARVADREAMTEAARLGADLRELAQRLASEMDRRAERMERLIAKADERIERMQAPQPPRAPERVANLSEPSHAKVHDLADQGLPIVEIARRVGKPTGQVELILALRKGSVSL